MELKEFISSGIIDSYILGTASIEEINQLNAMLEKYPHLKSELDTIENALLKISSSGVKEISPGLKEKIFSEIQFKNSPPPANKKPDPVILFKPDNNKMYLRYGIAASIGLLVISTILNVLQYNRSVKTDRTLAELVQEKNTMQIEMQNQKIAMNKLSNDLAVLTNRENHIIPLKGLKMSPKSMATVYMSSTTNEVYLYLNDLPAPPANMQYQLWAITDGKPVDAGVFGMDENNKLLKMKTVSPPQAFAVTLEKMGGSDTPDMDAMYLMGTI